MDKRKALGKGDFYKKYATDHNVTLGEAEKAVNNFLSTLQGTLVGGEDVNFTGFGKVSVVDRAEHEGRNPQTKEPMTIPASKAVRFSAGKTLKDAVNNK